MEVLAKREGVLVAVRQDSSQMSHCYWAVVEWEDGDYGYQRAHIEISKEEAERLGKHMFQDFQVTLSLKS